MKNMLHAVTAMVLLASVASAQDGTLPLHRLMPVSIQQVTIDDAFWSPKLKEWQPDVFGFSVKTAMAELRHKPGVLDKQK